MAKNGGVPDEYRGQLVETFRLRSQQAADYLRALLFALSAGAIAFIANEPELEVVPAIAIFLFACAIAALVYSWDVQKSKSIERMKKLRDEGYDAYIQYEEKIEQDSWRSNYFVDRFAYIFILAGAALEFVWLLKC